MSTSVAPVETPFLGYRHHHSYFKLALEDRGLVVPTFKHPDEGLRYLQEKNPSLIVLGTEFTSYRGFDEDKRWGLVDAGAQISLEVMARIAAMPKHARVTPVVVLNGWEGELAERFMDAGASEVISKVRIDPDVFADRVMRHIKRV